MLTIGDKAWFELGPDRIILAEIKQVILTDDLQIKYVIDLNTHRSGEISWVNEDQVVNLNRWFADKEKNVSCKEHMLTARKKDLGLI